MFLRSLLLIVLLLGLGRVLAGPPLSFAEKEAVARKVFDRLVMARGDLRRPAPDFVLTRSVSFGARADAATIILEEKAFDVCEAKGPTTEIALAGILAHELIHYYEAHDWEDGFVSTSSPEPGQPPCDVEADELEADLKGGFLAYLAGYGNRNVMPEVLAGIYDAYELPDKLTEYPSLDERKELATTAHRQLTQLIDVFDAANLLTALRSYDVAAEYYRYLLKEFQSREIYNNAGTLYALAARDLFPAEELKFLYPLQLDLDSRLSGQTRSVTSDREFREELLLKAIEQLERSVQLDAAYAPARLNLGCAYALLSLSVQPTDETLAEEYFLAARLNGLRALRQSDQGSATAAAARNLIGILAARSGDRREAERLFSTTGGPLAEANVAVLGGSDFRDLLPPPAVPEFAMEETIAERRPERPGVERGLVVLTEPRIELFAAADPEQGYRQLRHQLGDDGIDFLSTLPGYGGETALEVGIGTAREDLLAEYGNPAYVTETVTGRLLVYPSQRLIFDLRRGVVAGWTVFGR